MADSIFLLLYWTGPIGIGFFLVCLGCMIYLLTKADALHKSMQQKEKRKE